MRTGLLALAIAATLCAYMQGRVVERFDRDETLRAAVHGCSTDSDCESVVRVAQLFGLFDHQGGGYAADTDGRD